MTYTCIKCGNVTSIIPCDRCGFDGISGSYNNKRKGLF